MSACIYTGNEGAGNTVKETLLRHLCLNWMKFLIRAIGNSIQPLWFETVIILTRFSHHTMAQSNQNHSELRFARQEPRGLLICM